MFPFQIQFHLPESESAGIPVNIGIVNLMNNKEFNEEDDATRSDYAQSEDGCWSLCLVSATIFRFSKVLQAQTIFPVPVPLSQQTTCNYPSTGHIVCSSRRKLKYERIFTLMTFVWRKYSLKLLNKFCKIRLSCHFEEERSSVASCAVSMIRFNEF